MRYYIITTLCGVKDEEDSFDTLEEAVAERDKRNGGNKDRRTIMWTVIDENGNESFYGLC